MQQAIDKASALVEAHAYIRRFAGRTVVVKVGGSIMDEPQSLARLIGDICFMKAVGIRPVLIHGGGKSITQAMQKAGLEAHFVQGRRYTDQRTLTLAEHVLVNEINARIVKCIEEQGYDAMGLHSLGSCAVFGKRLFIEVPGDDAKSPARKVDIGFVGETDWINADLLNALLDAGKIPVIAPIGRDQAGGKLNINADSVAGHVAGAVKSEKLILVSDTHGIRTDHTADSFASHLTRTQIQGLMEQGVVAGGMLPKVEACFTALEAGVAKAHIIDGRIQHSLLLEIYTDTGIGTEIVL